jgi:hypothetical protein
MFYVLNYSPLMGRSGTTVTIDTLFNQNSSCQDVHIRIVIGCMPIPTAIKNIEGYQKNLWRCTGTVPEFASQKFASTHTVNISIEAVIKRDVVLDSVAFGFFTYREYGKGTERLFQPHRSELFVWQVFARLSRYILASSAPPAREARIPVFRGPLPLTLFR